MQLGTRCSDGSCQTHEDLIAGFSAIEAEAELVQVRLKLCAATVICAEQNNAIKLTEDLLIGGKAERSGCATATILKKSACQTDGGGLRLKNYRLLSRRNVHCREAVAGDFGTRIKAIWSARRQGSL